MRLAALALAVVAAALAGCVGGDGDTSVAASRIDALVLKDEDVGRLFSLFDEGRQIAPDFTPLRSELRRFGRQDGWKARFRRRGSRTTKGPLVVESRADLFEQRGGAEDDLEAYRAEFDDLVEAGRGSARVVEAPLVGDESVGLRTVQIGTPAVRFYTIAWRQHNVTASVSVNGFRLTMDDAVALARKQERRIERAADESS